MLWCSKSNSRSSCSCNCFKYDLIFDKKLKRNCCCPSTSRRSIYYRVTLATFKVLLVIFFILFVVLPLIYKCSYKLQSAVVFLNFANVPANADYAHPESYGLEGARNFYLTTDENIKLGVWQILPENLKSLPDNTTDATVFENVLANGENIVIYNHGNAGSRATQHRIELYSVLRKHFHVIAYDYRSYGDSSNVQPTEDGIVRDCMFVYKWVANKTKANIYVWGHSLGTSLSTHSLARLQEENIQPSGLILESPFNNMHDEISEFPLANMFKRLPWFSYTVVDAMMENNFTFKTDQFICNVNAPVLILHAEDDIVVPFKLGRKLYESALKCRNASQGKIQFHAFLSKYKYGHKYICRAPEIHDLIEKFVQQTAQLSY